jgi:hypothetical protein
VTAVGLLWAYRHTTKGLKFHTCMRQHWTEGALRPFCPIPGQRTCKCDLNGIAYHVQAETILRDTSPSVKLSERPQRRTYPAAINPGFTLRTQGRGAVNLRFCYVPRFFLPAAGTGKLLRIGWLKACISGLNFGETDHEGTKEKAHADLK